MEMAGTGELEGGELGGASTFERLLRKHDIAHDFSPSVSPQQASAPPLPSRLFWQCDGAATHPGSGQEVVSHNFVRST